MRASVQEVFGDPTLKGRTVAIQGFGKVASNLARHLKKEGACLLVAELHPQGQRRATEEFGARIVPPEAILEAPCDILAPCALGGVLNKDTIPRLRCRLVCGGANNQLLEEADGARLPEAGILYAPDYAVNAGGLINLSFELTRYDREAAMVKVGKIYETMLKIIAISKEQGLSTARTADWLAERRLEAARHARGTPTASNEARGPIGTSHLPNGPKESS